MTDAEDLTDAEKRIYATRLGGKVSLEDMAVYCKKKGIEGTPYSVTISFPKSPKPTGLPPYDFTEQSQSGDVVFFRNGDSYQCNP